MQPDNIGIKQQDNLDSGQAIAASHTLYANEQEALDNHLSLRQPPEHPHKDVSKGEKIFNTAIYKGIGFAGAAGLSIYLTDMFKNGIGKKFFQSAAEKIAPNFGKLRGLNGPQAMNATQSFLMFVGLFSGGTLLLYPIKKAEESKLKIVKWLDAKRNASNPPSAQELEVQQKSHERIANEPEPSWGNLILGRLLATTAVFAAIFAAAGHDKNIAEYVAKETTEAMQESKNPKIAALGKSERVRNMLGIGVIDMYLTLIAEETLYLTTRIYKGMHRKKQEAPEQASNLMLTQKAYPEPKALTADIPLESSNDNGRPALPSSMISPEHIIAASQTAQPSIGGAA